MRCEKLDKVVKLTGIPKFVSHPQAVSLEITIFLAHSFSDHEKFIRNSEVCMRDLRKNVGKNGGRRELGECL